MVRRQFCSICVPMFTYVLALHFKVNLTSILYSEFYGQDLLQTCRYETRELWGLFAEVREKSVLEFRKFWHFFFKHMPISRTFLYLQENKYHSLKVAPFFIKGATNHRNRLNRSCRKTRFKNIYNPRAHINRFGPL